MKKKSIRYFSFILIVEIIFLLSGCDGITYPEFSILSSSRYSPKAPDFNILLTSSDIKRDYEEIAVINVRSSSWTKIDKINETLRKTAGKLGADAVIRINYGHEGMWGSPTAIGIAVHFKD
ncbi:MAG: hypothetical protein HY754_01590 [Nitrospirae bacterium]|nr:hypothetical protein [Nitrospirota bacterium]